MYNPFDGGSGIIGGSSSDIDRLLYVQMKLLNFVEVAYIENRISQEVYSEKIQSIMSKINTLKQQTHNFNVDNFFIVLSCDSRPTN